MRYKFLLYEGIIRIFSGIEYYGISLQWEVKNTYGKRYSSQVCRIIHTYVGLFNTMCESILIC